MLGGRLSLDGSKSLGGSKNGIRRMEFERTSSVSELLKIIIQHVNNISWDRDAPAYLFPENANALIS